MRRMKAKQIFDENMKPLRLFVPSGRSSIREISEGYWESYPDEIGMDRYVASRWDNEGMVSFGEACRLDDSIYYKITSMRNS